MRRLGERYLRAQTPFSVVSGILSLMLALVLVTDLVVGHPHSEVGAVALFLTIYLIGGIVPLALGRRYPRWAGLVMVAVSAAWSSYLLASAQYPYAEVSALLELPVAALYVAWFFPRRIARWYMILSILRIASALVWNPDLGGAQASGVIMIGYTVLIAVFCFEGALAVRRQTQLQAFTDPLTGALNRRGLLAFGETLRARAARESAKVSVALVDFDDFKLLNDAEGHAAGDAALRESATVWAGLVGMSAPLERSDGLVARLGGDEFALMLRRDPAAVECLLHRARADSVYDWSWGVAPVAPGEHIDAALARADKALYRAKRGL